MGFRIKGNQAVFGRVLSTNSQTWARFWLTAGWVIIILAGCYLLFMIILHFYLTM